MDLWEVIDPSTSKDDNATIEDYLKLYASADENPRINTIVILLVYVPVFLLAFFGNLIVLLVILTDSRMRKSTANYFLVNLAVTDLLVAVICIPMTAINYVYNVWVLGTTACKITSYMQGKYIY
ncbi:gastrin/cholecystokinin type B receptor [Biomphalaria pfeifferi]|uniref:Gastrin/cholecystokinin type B receptor n=1 Tax=Biomphalaria pfeifferi TaxID=112525 RepID=A0AAD8BSW6_BIOPF|nr:gastrin/cholecystokinin type B receptor [Biomphalaria pfeifferi]